MTDIQEEGLRYREAIELALGELTGLHSAELDAYESACFDAAVRALSRALDQTQSSEDR